MNIFRMRHLVGVSLGIAWGLIYGAVFSSLPIIQRLELDVQDGLIRLHQPGHPPKEILLLKINQSDLSGYDLHNLYKLNLYYTALVKSLFENGARVVVVNLPEQMKQYIDTDTNARLERPLMESINHYAKQIVLVTRPNNLPSGASALNLYNNLLPFDDESASRSIAPEQIVSYFRYTPNPQNLNSPARRADLFSHFSYEDDPNPNLRHRVKSVATLALEKFYQAPNDRALESMINLQVSSIQINFWGPADTFPAINFQLQCSSAQVELAQCHGSFSSQSVQTLRNRLVIVDLPDGKTSETYRERSPYGEMSVAEVQANFIASLMTHSFLATTPWWSDDIITSLGLVLMSLHITRRIRKPSLQSVYRLNLWLFLGLIGGYIGFSFLLFWQGFMLPLTVPIFGWLVTGAGTVTYLMFRQSAQQQQKLAERQAVLLQARKLLHRVTTDIHDGPLQELKLVMDGIERLGMNQPSPSIDALLDRLETIGLSLRNQLSNTRTIAEKLEITPELEFGLLQGIQQWLHQLIQSGELTLQVKETLQPLREPRSDSAWIDTREDIFRFFREAIANVIRHAQPPNGSATHLSVSLTQKEHHCRLTIENNGTQPTPLLLNSPQKKRRGGGYGTKLMATIAAEIPNGVWHQMPLDNGGMQVTLEWTMDTP